ncbi:MAG: TlpA disulfide reductase family protein [Myxococcota bacterium]|nr:TlpA disulfide reductase family protein [Myxococcota bacterium]
MTDHDKEIPEGRPGPSRLARIGREIVINVGIIGVVVLLMMWWQREGQRGGGGKLNVGEPAPAFSLADSRTGAQRALADFRGRPTILNFWATWCGPCVRGLPIMEALHQSAEGRYHLVTVTREPPSTVVPFLEQRGLEIPALFDANGEVSRRYKANSIPTTVILDREGRIVHDFSGGAYEDILREHMEQLRAPPAQTGTP